MAANHRLRGSPTPHRLQSGAVRTRISQACHVRSLGGYGGPVKPNPTLRATEHQAESQPTNYPGTAILAIGADSQLGNECRRHRLEWKLNWLVPSHVRQY